MDIAAISVGHNRSIIKFIIDRPPDAKWIITSTRKYKYLSDEVGVVNGSSKMESVRRCRSAIRQKRTGSKHFSGNDDTLKQQTEISARPKGRTVAGKMEHHQ